MLRLLLLHGPLAAAGNALVELCQLRRVRVFIDRRKMEQSASDKTSQRSLSADALDALRSQMFESQVKACACTRCSALRIIA